MPPMPPLPPMSQANAQANYPDRGGYGMRGAGAMGNGASYRGQADPGGSMAGANGAFADNGRDNGQNDGWGAYEQGSNQNYYQADDRRGG
jgi:hypothetical protein